ncbi:MULTISPECIES: serine hydrolase domain-containing protein [unclassified Streptomyces]|uniref:serine hydrolase domain-containing protein n=1 Tax=unclassified Streptomyces TaxID=2593676 RepID=UPI0036E306DA
MSPQATALVARLAAYVEAGEVAGGALRFRRHGVLVESAALGRSDAGRSACVNDRSVFRLASLTKPVVAVAVLQAVEAGVLGLDDPVSRLIPSYASTAVAQGVRVSWTSHGGGAVRPRTVPAARPVTVRDLLTHSSGLGQGPDSQGFLDALSRDDDTLAERVDSYARVPGDAQPGESAGYSPKVGFDVLGRIVEICAGTDLQSALRASVLGPLGMTDTAFVLTDEQERRLVRLYSHDGGRLRDESGCDGDQGMRSNSAGLHSGAAGLFSTVVDMDRFARMLAGGGSLEGTRILRPSTVRAMNTERARGARELSPGREWGLGVMVGVAKDDDVRAPGAYGWSGAWGTHLVVDPRNATTLVLMVNRADIGGADSPLSRDLERLALRTCKRLRTDKNTGGTA